MLPNGNNFTSYNDYENVPYIPYKILEELLLGNNEEIEKFWKLLKYPTSDCLLKDNITEEEKSNMIWRGEPKEQNYNIFIKPQVSDSLDTAESQTQMRIYRHSMLPIDSKEAVINMEIDFLTHDKSCLVYDKGMLCERTDLLVSSFLRIFNGRDIEYGKLEFNKNLSRTCQDLLTISNGKSTYGRALVVSLRYMNLGIGGACG